MTVDAVAQESSARGVVVCGPPIMIEGVRSIGCSVLASTGFLQQLPALAVQHTASHVLVISDGWAPEAIAAAAQRIRRSLPNCRVLVLLPQGNLTEQASLLGAAGCAIAVTTTEPDALRQLLGLEPPKLLTPREVDVVVLAAEGLTNRVIGRRLGLTENTVKNYLREVHRKLGAHSRTDAVMRAARAGYSVLPLR